MPTNTRFPQNLLLRSLSKDAYSRLADDLEQVDLRFNQVLSEPQDLVQHIIFPGQDVLVSLIATTPDDESAEVAIVGSEGFVGFCTLLGQRVTSHRALTQMPGPAHRISVKRFQEACKADPSIQRTMLTYVDLLIAQISQTALCNRLHPVEERLARWLLMSDDRVESANLPFTHEILSHMLGTRRSTVSLTAATLQAAGLIEYNRGKIVVIDRKGLENAACSCYPIMVSNFKGFASRVRG